MNINAMAVANYFVDIAQNNKVEIRQFGLMKRIYITHGFCLAILDESILDPRFDVVEAWKNGPVIPSVYHSFKHNKNNPIQEKSIIAEFVNNNIQFITPELSENDEYVKKIANEVWKKYLDYTDIELIKLLHRKGTPWELCYEEGKNNPIPDLYTKAFYKKVIGK